MENFSDNNAETEENFFSVTATHILEYLYCPRFAYFENVLDIPEHQEKRFKVQKGREIHEEVRKQNPGYLRKKIGMIRKESDVYLAHGNIRGIMDEILFLDDGSAAPLDYKYAEYKEHTFKNHRFQLVLYAKLIQAHYKVPVKKAFIVYTRSKNKLVEIEITQKMYAELDKIVRDLANIIQKGFYPESAKHKAKCADCCYRNICEQSI